MALLSTAHPSLLLKNPRKISLPPLTLSNPRALSISFLSTPNPRILSSTRIFSTFSGSAGESSGDADSPGSAPPDEWGEEAAPEVENAYSKLSPTDPPTNEDEWGGSDDYVVSGNGSAPAAEIGVVDAPVEEERLGDLKRCLVDTVYGTELGFRASTEIRAEVFELVSQLEAANPTPAPTENLGLLDGNWVLVYTAFSELLPLLAIGAIPLLKVEKIGQTIDTRSLIIENSITLASPFATFSFSASAAFEVRSPSRIQVEFKEGTLRPPEVKSSVEIPQSINVFGQSISLLPVQQPLNSVQEAVASFSRAISGQPPLKVPIPGERTKSWLLTTYLDKDLRISRGDGGLFVLAKEGSSLLDQ